MVNNIFSRIQKLCEDRVAELFDPTKFEVSGVYGGINFDSNQPYCVVDFRRKGMSANIDCKEYCWDAIEHFAHDECEEDDKECFDRLEEECVEECEDNVKKILTGSIEFDPLTLRVISSTIPTDCEEIWGSEEMDNEEFEEIQNSLQNSIRKYGCKPQNVNWMHPHEIIPIETPELGYEEYPAMCYYHVSDCGLRAVLRLMEDDVL